MKARNDVLRGMTAAPTNAVSVGNFICQHSIKVKERPNSAEGRKPTSRKDSLFKASKQHKLRRGTEVINHNTDLSFNTRNELTDSINLVLSKSNSHKNKP